MRDKLNATMPCFLYVKQTNVFQCMLFLIFVCSLSCCMHSYFVLLLELHLSCMIRPICITILYHNLPLFIDICLIMRYYLCLFLCFCMFDDSWRMNCRSQVSDGKRGDLMQFREDQKNTRKCGKIIFSQKT